MRAQVEQSVEGSCVYSLIRRAIHSLGQGNQCYWFTSFWILAIASSDQEMNITSDFPSSTDDRLQLMSSPFLFPLLPSPLPDSPLSPPSSIPCPPFFLSLSLSVSLSRYLYLLFFREIQLIYCYIVTTKKGKNHSGMRCHFLLLPWGKDVQNTIINDLHNKRSSSIHWGVRSQEAVWNMLLQSISYKSHKFNNIEI